MPTVIEVAKEKYAQCYEESHRRHTERALETARTNELSEQKAAEVEHAAQKEAIMLATIQTLEAKPEANSTDVWKSVYAAHLYRKSGIDDPEVLEKALSASQSWKKSSGHAFEEMIKLLGTTALHRDGIDIVLQRDLSKLIADGKIDNELRDIEWLKLQLEKDIFDLYAIIHYQERSFVFGCIQSKASVRDRVTRDREPSVHAMEHFFWSVIVVFDAEYLKMPKFRYMVNGGNDEFPFNGWHGMYVFDDRYIGDRIYKTNLQMETFKEHAKEAAAYWLSQRQWFNIDWKATE